MRRIVLASATLALALGAAFPRKALAYGLATHSAVGEEAARKLANDPRHAFIPRDRGLTNCFRWGSTFPDVRSIAQAAAVAGPRFDALKKKLEASAWIKEVKLSTQDVKPLGFDTHDRPFLLFLVEKADRSGHDHFRAFALGCLTHAIEDTHAQVLMEPLTMIRTGSGDIGIRPLQDPANLAGWNPGSELDDIFDAMVDFRRTADEVKLVREAPRRLVTSGSIFGRLTRSLQRQAEVKHLTYVAAKEWHDTKLGLTGFITERGFQNLVRLFEASMTLYPYVFNKESAGDAARVFKDRFIDLPWWADAIAFVADVLVHVVTIGQLSIYDLAACIAKPQDKIGGALQTSQPLGDIAFGFMHGGDAERRVRATYGANVEFQRALASGLFNKDTYVVPLDDAAALARDVVVRRAASRWADKAQWETFDGKASQAGGIGGLATLMGQGSGYAGEPALLVKSARFLDAATGQDVTSIHYPNDVGRTLRVELELFAPILDSRAANGRDVTVTIRSDKQAGRADPTAARATRRIDAADLAPQSYGSRPRPRIVLDFVAPADAGQQGLYVELDAGRGVFFTTNTAPFAPLMAGRPHYAKAYTTYAGYPPAVKITR